MLDLGARGGGGSADVLGHQLVGRSAGVEPGLAISGLIGNWMDGGWNRHAISVLRRREGRGREGEGDRGKCHIIRHQLGRGSGILQLLEGTEWPVPLCVCVL